ncbi:glutamate decarboxylase [Streptomyces nanshensis]|uniref:Glutamate decarboxylase n=1 Tax=Streptomyces nanshensis TaxID=518642 RepID=A0A1E7KVT2_9ACTN|nr:glutamate decarboxylase [Streptomyces nanshensis]OEV08035.1 glutamate decarboxylase [Streptomyces nanshensis]
MSLHKGRTGTGTRTAAGSGTREADGARPRRESAAVSVNPFYGEADPVSGVTTEPPVHRLAAEPMAPDAARQLVHDELMLDGNSRLNLATFVTTWMEPQAAELMALCRDKNMVDKDEYPRTAELERRCVAMLADLWNAPDPSSAVGCSTTGSSEACMLAGMALKRRWALRAGGRYPAKARPNLVMGANVQVCWEKFCNFWEVEARQVPMEGERFHIDPHAAAELCDENTIGVVAVLGSTFDGSYEPVAEVCAALDSLQERTGHDIPVHVDGASGGMIAPFLDPDLVWDFRLPRVASINTSGHKYGLVYPGVGWALWRSPDMLPEELVFRVNYLGGDMPTFALNFSRPGAQVAAQYYTFLRLGRGGFHAVQHAAREVARSLAARIGETGDFRLLTHGDQLPVFACTTLSDVTAFDVFDVSRRMRERGWLVPAYTFPANRQDLSVLRVVCRNGFTADLADLFMDDLMSLLPELRGQSRPLGRPASLATAFHH